MKVFELISDESKWTKKAYARDKNNVSIGYYHDDACKFCVEGGLARLYSNQNWSEFSEMHNRVFSIIKRRWPGKYHNILSWNDAPETTFEIVQEVLQEAGV